MSIEEARVAFLTLEKNLEEVRTALLALPGVHKVDVCLHILDPVTQVRAKVHYRDVHLSHEEREQAIESVKEIGDALTRRLGCALEVEGIGFGSWGAQRSPHGDIPTTRKKG